MSRTGKFERLFDDTQELGLWDLGKLSALTFVGDLRGPWDSVGKGYDFLVDDVGFDQLVGVGSADVASAAEYSSKLGKSSRYRRLFWMTTRSAIPSHIER